MAASPVVISIDPTSPRTPIPPDFSGFSFETGRLRRNHDTGAYFFDSSNTQLLTIFRNLGIESLRIGGNTVDRGYVPSTADIDALFRFAKAANVKVVYSLRLANGDAAQDASIAGSMPMAKRFTRIPICGPTSRRSSWTFQSPGPSSCGLSWTLAEARILVTASSGPIPGSTARRPRRRLRRRQRPPRQV